MSKLVISAGICFECGALVRGTLNENRHTKFHEKIDELIDWAKSISDILIAPYEEEEGRESSGKMLGQDSIGEEVSCAKVEGYTSEGA